MLLDEVKGRSNTSDERYAAALRGESLGTHSSGSSRHAVVRVIAGACLLPRFTVVLQAIKKAP